MDRMELRAKFDKSSPIYENPHYISKIVHELDKEDPNRFLSHVQENLVILMEELSELSQEVSKVIRNRSEDKLGLIEEIADVELSIEFLKDEMNITDFDINRIKNIKIERLKRRALSERLKKESKV